MLGRATLIKQSSGVLYAMNCLDISPVAAAAVLKSQLPEDRLSQFADDIFVIDVAAKWPSEALPSRSIVLVDGLSSKEVINLAVDRKVGAHRPS
ncbi:unnamed protein product [Sphagnum balticum]